MAQTILHTVQSSRDRLDKYLVAQGLATSRSEASRWISDGFVMIGGEAVTKPAHTVRAGDAICISKPLLKTLDLTPKDLALKILFEDEVLLVLDKPAGLVVHPGAGNYDHSLVHGLLHHCADLSGIGGVERPGIVHRLDKGTSGVMVVAKSDVAHQDLSRQFQNHEIEKEYRALTLGRIAKKEQTLKNLMKRSELNRKKFVVNQKKGKEAITHVTVIKANDRVTLAAVKIATGRTHQIRVHLSFIGHPILGDATYGGTKKLNSFTEDEKKYVRDLDRPLLHAFRLAFRHPQSRKTMAFEADLPPEFEAALKRFLP